MSRNYLIIGGSSGIGKRLSEELWQNGHQVFATFCNTNIQSDNIPYFKFDVLNDDFDLSKIPENLDGLVYCPGSINLKPFKSFKEEDFINDYRLQVTGFLKVLKSVLPYLKKSNQSSIVLYSTIAVQKGFPYHAQVSASKGAIEGLTRSLSAELSPNIRINCIAPSLTDTNLASKLLSTEEKRERLKKQNPMQMIGETIDIAAMAEFLLSEKAKWITVQIIHIDGGASVI